MEQTLNLRSLTYLLTAAILLPATLPGTAQAQCELPIPDDSTTGVTDTYGVAHQGTVTDVNLVIGSLVHTYVGDLSIYLTS